MEDDGIYMTQELALEILKSGKSALLTGPAGSGKTYTLNKFIDFIKESNKSAGLTASTGIASTHINGRTIHAWAGIGIKSEITDAQMRRMLADERLTNRIRLADVLVIDEISMLGGKTFDLVNQVVKKVRKNFTAFGGMQVVLCGDFFQLPPVNKEGEMDFVFQSKAWEELDLEVLYLSEQFRQSDDGFLTLLNGLREGRATTRSLQLLKTRLNADVEMEIEPTRLYTHNVDVDLLNRKRLADIEEEGHFYHSKTYGPDHLVESLLRNCLAPEKLELRKGASVMFVRNNFEMGYVNGTLGTVINFSTEGGWPIVKTSLGRIITVEPEDWEIEEDDLVLASVSQVPLRLAWAITIHKSQGMSLDSIEVDLSKAFIEGLGYVALSRVRSLEGLKLLGANKVAFQANEIAKDADKMLRMRGEATLLNHLGNKESAE